MNRKYRVCFVVPTLSKGGLQRVTTVLANNFIEYSDVSIITLTDDVVEYFHNNSIEIQHLNTKQTFKSYQLLGKLIRGFKGIKPDYVIGFSEVFNPITILAAKLCNVKVTVSDRSSPKKLFSIRDRLLKKLTYRFADGIIVQTEFAKKMLLNKINNKNVTVIPNPIISLKNTTINAEAKAIATLGRLVPTKNHLELVKIFCEINQDDWQLLIAGEGQSRTVIEDYISINKLNDRVKLLGQVEDIELFFAQASIFAFTSLSEGFPNALMEGMCYPLAAIAYDCPAGVSDLITDNYNGYLIPMQDGEMFKTKLSKLMNSVSKREEFMANSIKMRGKYSQKSISKQYYSFITNNII